MKRTHSSPLPYAPFQDGRIRFALAHGRAGGRWVLPTTIHHGVLLWMPPSMAQPGLHLSVGRGELVVLGAIAEAETRAEDCGIDGGAARRGGGMGRGQAVGSEA